MSSPFVLLAAVFGLPLILYMTLKKPLWLFYLLLFVLLEPSRYLSLSDINLGLFSIKSYELLLPLIYISCLINRQRPLSVCLTRWLVLFSLMVACSLLNGLMSGYGAGAFNYARPFFSMGFAVAIPLYFKGHGETFRLARIFAILAVAFIIVEMVALQTGLGYSLIYSPIRASYNSLMSDTSCSNLAFVFIYGFATFSFGMRHALLRLVLLGFSFMCTVMSSARAVWLGMIVALGGFLFLARTKTKIYLTLFSLLGVMLLFFMGSMYIARYDMTLAERLPLLFQADEGNAQWRMMAWSQTVDDIKQHPILGWPMGNEPLFYVEKTGVFNSNATHNEFLKVARYTGLVGLFFFLGLMLQTCGRAMYCIKNSCDLEKSRMLGLFLCFVFILVTSTFSQRITSIDICPIVWIVVGLIWQNWLEIREAKAQTGAQA